MNKNVYHTIGLMSGSSLDGVDIAYCVFEKAADQWQVSIKQAECVPFPERWTNRLQFLPVQSALTFFKTHTYFGHYLGEVTKKFINKHGINADLIASHGHTIFHEPHNRLTAQIGDGAAIAGATGITTITQLRTTDVALFGQGAPIVPIGDLHLFPTYRYCLNLGGIANISIKNKEGIVAFDVCACNQILNRLANEVELPYDDKGKLAASGAINAVLLEALNAPDFFHKKPPKSLSNQWVMQTMMEVIDQHSLRTPDLLATFCEHIAQQIAQSIQHFSPQSSEEMLVTGGGAFNDFLMKRISTLAKIQVIIPDEKLISFKEAMVMAFMGVLRIREESNVWRSVTGAKRDTICGAVWKG